MIRETGIALAMLAVYVLTLLLPLHQAAGLQRDLNALGYSTLESWSICQPLAQDEDGSPQEAAALNCPATGIAKHKLAVVLPVVSVLPQPVVTVLPDTPIGLPMPAPGLPEHVGQSRAPPVLV